MAEESNLVEKPAPDPNVVIYSDTNKPVVGATPGNILKEPNGSGADNFTEKYRPGSIGQCVWYAYSRFYEVYGIDLQYYELGLIEDMVKNVESGNVIEYGYTNGSLDFRKEAIVNKTFLEAVSNVKDVRSLSIATYTPPKGKEIGHVVFVEYVEKDINGNPTYVYITEGNTQADGEYHSETDGVV